MPGTNDSDRMIGLAQQLTNGLGDVTHRRCRRLLDEDVAILALCEGVQDQLDR